MADLTQQDFERLFKKLADEQNRSIRETIKKVDSSQESRAKAFDKHFQKQSDLVETYLHQTGVEFTNYGKQFQSSIENLAKDTAKQSALSLKLQKKQIKQLEKEAKQDFEQRRISAQEHDAFMLQLDSIRKYQKENSSFLRGAAEGLKSAIMQNIDMISIASGILGDSPLIGIATKLGLEAFSGIKERRQQANQAKQDRRETRRAYDQGLTPFAAGGIVMQPTPALIGEAGPEAVIPLSELDKALKGGVYENPYDKITAQSTQDLLAQSELSFNQSFRHFEGIGGALSLLSNIALGVKGIPLTFIEQFSDFFTNFAGLFPNRAARKRQEKFNEKQNIRDKLQLHSVETQDQMLKVLENLYSYFLDESQKEREYRLESERLRNKGGVIGGIKSSAKSKTNRLTQILNDPVGFALEYAGAGAAALGGGALTALGLKGAKGAGALSPAATGAAATKGPGIFSKLAGTKFGGKLGALGTSAALLGGSAAAGIGEVGMKLGKLLEPLAFLIKPFKRLKIDFIGQFFGKGLMGVFNKVMGIFGIFDIFKGMSKTYDQAGEGAGGLLASIKEGLKIAFEFFNLPLWIANLVTNMAVSMFGTEDIKAYFEKYATSSIGGFSLLTLAENMIYDIFDDDEGALILALRALFTKDNFMTAMKGTGRLIDIIWGSIYHFVADRIVDFVDFLGFTDTATQMQKTYDTMTTFEEIFALVGEKLYEIATGFINSVVESEMYKTIKSYFAPGSILGDFFAKIQAIVGDYFAFVPEEYDMKSALSELQSGDESQERNKLLNRLGLIQKGDIEERGSGLFSRAGIQEELISLEKQRQRNFLESLKIIDEDTFGDDDLSRQQLAAVLKQVNPNQQLAIIAALRSLQGDTDFNATDLQYIASLSKGTNAQMLGALMSSGSNGGGSIIINDNSQTVNNAGSRGSSVPLTIDPNAGDLRGDAVVDGRR